MILKLCAHLSDGLCEGKAGSAHVCDEALVEALHFYCGTILQQFPSL